MSPKLCRGISLAVTAAGTLLCAVIDMRAAMLLLGTAGVLLVLTALSERHSSAKIHALCDEIGAILNGAERVQFDLFEESEMSILASEVQKMTVCLRAQNSALQKEQVFLKESLEDISHQLRTPLTSMMLILEQLRRPEQNRQTRTAQVQELLSLLSRMQWLIETLLSLSRLDAGAVHFREERVECRRLIADALAPLEIALELKDIAVHTEITGAPAFCGDFAYCTEALENLLKNCMEHTPEGGSIAITAAENSIYTQIVITDSGAGIPETDLPHIFERFYRSSDFAKKGYGIGLAFAQKIITAQRGSVQVRNAAPHGAQFDLRFYKTVV